MIEPTVVKTVSNTIESVEKSNLNEGSVIKSSFFLHEENIKNNKKTTIPVLKKILINLSENIIKNLAVKINILILNKFCEAYLFRISYACGTDL